MPEARYVLIDVFTPRPLAGNQLAVFTDASDLTDAQMQALAKELRFSECTFVLPPRGGGDARIRIFTPSEELPFAGHPTLGAAFVLAEESGVNALRIETSRGIVPIELEWDYEKVAFGRMKQPVPSWGPFERVGGLLMALGITSSNPPVEIYDNGPRHIFVGLPHAEGVSLLSPDRIRLAAIAGEAGVSCFSVDGPLVKMRYFEPGVGVDEDAATGSAAGALAVHLARHGLTAWGEEIEVSQGMEIGRPSTLFARAEGSSAHITGVEVGGSAVIVGRGSFTI